MLLLCKAVVFIFFFFLHFLFLVVQFLNNHAGRMNPKGWVMWQKCIFVYT